MRLPICLLALAFCTAAPAATPVYRFQALIDRDRSADTGCDAETRDGVVHGIELRSRADTDRTTRLAVVTEVCVGGRWQTQAGDVPEQPLALGQGRLGSDRVEWPLDAGLFAGAENVGLRVVAENLGSGFERHRHGMVPGK